MGKKAFSFLFSLGLFFFSIPAAAIPSSSAHFSNTRSADDASGSRSTSPSFQNTDSLGLIAGAAAAPDFQSPYGFLPGYFYPAAVIGLTSNACTPGEIVLSWATPGDDGMAAGSAPKGFIVKISTSPNASPSINYITFSGAPSAGAPPGAGVEGSTRTMFLPGLINGVTYYIDVVAVEADGTVGALGPGTTAVVNLTGAVLSPLNGQTGFKTSLLRWPSPTSASPSCIPSSYQVLRATSPVGPFTAVLPTVSTTDFTDTGVLAGSTYYYEVAALNPADQAYATSPVTGVFVRTKPTLPPTDVLVSVSGSSATLTWNGPTEYNFGLGFANPAAPRADELTGYRVWRSTGMYAPWTLLAFVSTAAETQFVDPATQPGDYYKVTAVNITEESQTAYWLDTGGYGHVPTPDRTSELILPPDSLAPVAAGNLWAQASTQPMTTAAAWEPQSAPAGQPVLASLQFDLMQGTEPVTPQVTLPKPATLQLSYASQALAAPDQTSVYWNGGRKWIKLFGTADPSAQVVRTQVYQGGLYQLRGLERTQDFNFNTQGLSNKFITPNGDGKNDFATFSADNPRGSEVVGKIFDLRGALVTQFCDTTDPQVICKWDGKANGSAVQGGVYIYQLTGDGHSFTGTVVVIR